MTIKVGDRVMLVYAGCACVTQFIGDVSEVRAVQIGEAYCQGCFHNTTHGPHADIDLGGVWGPIPFSWLVKLPPDAEQIDEDEDKTLPEVIEEISAVFRR